jgi:hypothetical protein
LVVVKVRIKQHERGLWFRHGDFKGLLKPGEYLFWSRLVGSKRDTVEVVNTLAMKFEHRAVGDARAESRAARGAGGRGADPDSASAGLEGWVGSARAWRGPDCLLEGVGRIQVEVFDSAEVRFSHSKLEAVLAHPSASAFLESVEVEPHVEMLLLINGVLSGRLAPGKHAFWKGAGRVRVVPVDRREQTATLRARKS